jgi:hypothetical protein
VANPGAQVTAISEADRALNVFAQIAANSNPNIGFTSHFTQDRIAMGSKVDLVYSARMPGYVNVLYVGSDLRDIAVLAENFPVNPAGGALLGSAMVTEPSGNNQFLVLWTRDTLNVKDILKNARDGRAMLSAVVAQGLGCAVDSKRNTTSFIAPAGSGCNDRNSVSHPAVEFTKDGMQGYGAARLTVAGY